MNSTNTLTDWRELAEQLTPAQVADLAEREQRYSTDPDLGPALLAQARAHVAANRIDSERFGHLPAPAGAVQLEHWEVDPVEGGWRRYFAGPRWAVADLEAGVLGTQYADGRIERAVRIEVGGADFDAGHLRLIAAALCEAAEDLDRHAVDGGNPWPVDSTFRPCCRAIGRHGPGCKG